MLRSFVWLCWLLLLGCSAVVVPRERFYRLEVPTAAVVDPQRAGVLRVHDLQLQRAVDSDCLQRLDGVQLQARPLARWVAPLDRLVTDALVLGLSRARVCDLVKGGADPGDETWSLRGRIIDFVEVAGAAGPETRVAIELWLEAGSLVLLHDEFQAREVLANASDEAAVAALSRGLSQVVAEVVARMRGQNLFAIARAKAAAATAVPAK